MFLPCFDLDTGTDTSFPHDAGLKADIFVDLESMEQGLNFDFMGFLRLHLYFIQFSIK